MDSRRDFLKKAALLAAGGGVIPASIQRAMAIDPAPGTTFLDAEHVVILMQENRSFDHCYGALRGVRGFNDPRAVTLPDGNPVWLQTNRNGETYAPFRLNLHDTKATWMSSLPHSWVDQTDARNGGRQNGWLDAKHSGNHDYAHLPLTMGYYDRTDIPFYYSLADAFTVCDQNFCSSLTGTTPNRLHLWTGTIREKPSIESKACVRNEDVDYGAEAKWTTFPERLEDHGVSWRIYQNELSLDTGLEGEKDGWLANFTDNPIEWFTQYQVRFSPGFRRQLPVREQRLAAAIAKLEAEPQPDEAQTKKLTALRAELAEVRHDLATWTDEAYAKLSPRERNLHEKAFTTNIADPDYHELTTLTYRDGATERQMAVPKGDVLHQFRQDVRTGKLPTVSWIVAPENFSDHPGAPWYGAWYLSEVLDILTQNPEVWRKTIFILCYDENDGYYDHVPPFVPPHPTQTGTGRVSAGLDPSVEYVRPEQEQERQRHHPGSAGRSGPIGLGFRVPLVIASPWSRGGYVNSQVCDHTSILQLIETIVSHRTGRPLRETNISAWRRTVCGDLSSVFRPYRGEKIETPTPVEWKSFAGSIHQAQFRQLPNGFHKLSAPEIAVARENPRNSPHLPQQEPGMRPACPLPYELAVDGALDADRLALVVRFAAKRELFAERSAGAPFHVYAPDKVRPAGKAGDDFVVGRTWSYAVTAGDQLTDTWALNDFAEGIYHLRVHGPNGFHREFRGSAGDPALEVTLEPVRNGKTPTGDARLRLSNRDPKHSLTVEVEDLAYGTAKRTVTIPPAANGTSETALTLVLARSHGWYDVRLSVAAAPQYGRRYAGHIETGRNSFSDPFMGRVVV
jgi:phospholipase C